MKPGSLSRTKLTSAESRSLSINTLKMPIKRIVVKNYHSRKYSAMLQLKQTDTTVHNSLMPASAIKPTLLLNLLSPSSIEAKFSFSTSYSVALLDTHSAIYHQHSTSHP